MFVLSEHLGDGLQIVALHDAAGGVAGIGQHQRLGLWGNGRLQLLGSQTELVLRLRLHIRPGVPRLMLVSGP